MKYQKIRALGHRTIRQMWDGPVEVTEKLDGSQYRFWISRDKEGNISRHHGTKRTELHPIDGGVSDKLFNPVVRHMEEHGHKIPDHIDAVFGETLCKPKHNTLKYDAVPKGHLAIWGAHDDSSDHWLTYEELRDLAECLACDVVPLVCTIEGTGNGPTLETLDKLLHKESYLKGCNIEGLVFKNYTKDNLIGEEYIPFLAGKFVSEKFKEKMGIKKGKNRSNVLEDFLNSFATEAFWIKQINHLRDDGKLTYSPKDIGALMKEMHNDLDDEYREEIENFFYNHHIKDLKRRTGWGFPEFYKRWLVENSDEA